MSEIHPRETELARFSDKEAGAAVAEHLRWCARCRGVVADYRWLQGEITSTLAVAADTVAVPRPKWWVVQERMSAGQRRQMMGWRASAFASVALMVCFMLFAPNFLGPAVVAQTPQPEMVMGRAPVTSFVSGDRVDSMATSTPDISGAEMASSPTPAFVLPPTPPEVIQ